jgi:S1/P1 Nuclease
MARIALVLVSFFAMSCDAWAWGDEGHKIVCEIAMRVAVPSTRAEIRRLIKTDTEFDFFSDSCTWPDHPRKRGEEHFVNLSRDSSGLTSDTCPGAHQCVVSAIRKDAAVLASSDADDTAKLESLKFLGHWLGDIHQPLHVSFEDDRGGNNITVTGECQGKLHAAWDSCLVVTAVGTDVADAATDLMKSITPAKIEEWTHSDPADWANESFAIAERPGTKYCVHQGASCELPSPAKVKIDAAYVEANTPIVREQLQKAGVRLAHLLDAALGK